MTTTTPVVGNFSDIPLHGDREAQRPTEAVAEKHGPAATDMAYAGKH